MATWSTIRPIVLDELVRHDGLCDFDSPPICAHCLEAIGLYRCLNCVRAILHCSQCIVQRHEQLPLHRIEVRTLVLIDALSLTFPKVWQEGFYQPTSLRELGLYFYIGHQQTPCPSTNSFNRILVIDVTGAHYVNVQFCACEESPGWVEKYRQLLRICWYPASFNRPQTAFTFDLLDTYHKLTLQAKLNLYDFYGFVMQKTDNCGRRKKIVSFVMRTNNTSLG